jgi:cytochrome c peroxidase
MDDEKAISLAVWACVAVLMILIYVGAGNTASTKTAPPPIPNAGPLARPKSLRRAAIQTDMSALGRFLSTKNELDTAAFKTSNLRHVLVTAPYFHDGLQETLWDVIDHYNKGDGLQNPYLDEDIQPLALQESDIDDLVAFLASLTSNDYNMQAVRALARQRALSQTNRPQRATTRAFGPKPVKPRPPES